MMRRGVGSSLLASLVDVRALTVDRWLVGWLGMALMRDCMVKSDKSQVLCKDALYEERKNRILK